MSYPSQLDGTHLHRWVTRAVAELSERRAEINELNVFPVPDADTGSNMTHTMESALAAVNELDDAERASAAAVTRALAVGGARGARGNSGVVLSQVLRALSETAVKEPLGVGMLASALETAVKLVDRAITDPVEGTVVTVLRAASVAAREAAGTGAGLHDALIATVEAARTALANTPSQLRVLREAGVVDAGGAGLLVLLEALLAEVSGGVALPARPAALLADATESHGQAGDLEVMFLFTGDLDDLTARLRQLGDSLVVARITEETGTVHIHSGDAGAVIETAYAHGQVSDLRLEVLPSAPVVATPERIIVAVTPPGPIADLYRNGGAYVVTTESDTDDDPETDLVADILATVRATGASEVILLPNGLLSRRQLSAVDKAVRAFDQDITLLPTSRLVSGIAALTVHDAGQPLATAAYAMAEAAGAMRTAVAVPADRAALTAAGPCAKGDLLVEAHGQIVAVCDDLHDAILAASRHLLEAGGEQVTVLSAGDVDTGSLEDVLKVAVMAYPGEGLAAAAEIGVE